MKNKGIDLFSGIGGFHKAANENKIDIVFASDINDDTKDVYELNYNLKPEGDITKIESSSIPDADWLFAGFPCQPFSRGGKQEGTKDIRGTLFYDVARILEEKKIKYFLLENVQGLITNDEGKTWKIIHDTLISLGYYVPDIPIKISPTDLGGNQRRVRVFIPGIKRDFITKEKYDELINSIFSLRNSFEKEKFWFDNPLKEEYPINEKQFKSIEAWKDFRNITKQYNYSFAIWIDYMGKKIPKDTPSWKKSILEKNNIFYKENFDLINEWILKWNVKSFHKSHRKFEWSAGRDFSNWNNIVLQFRPSGLRAIKLESYPTITTISNQNPFIPVLNRRTTIRELLSLQNFNKDFDFGDKSYNLKYKMIGNAVNVKVISMILKVMNKYV